MGKGISARQGTGEAAIKASKASRCTGYMMQEGCGTSNDGTMDAGVHPGAHAEDGLAEDV